VHNPVIEGEYTWSPDPKWINIVEFYCPKCQVMLENEYLPPGHPITNDIELDIEAFKAKYGKEGAR
jgi:acetophenone carboxylase